MLTREAVTASIKEEDGPKASFPDGRDFHRLSEFFPVSDLAVFGFELAEGVEESDVEVKDWTRENILDQLKRDLDFAFEKALDRRGISSSAMWDVIKMWMWVLEDDLANSSGDDYAMYGLPLYKAVAVKYGFDNPIGDDSGSEDEYDEHDW